MMGYDVEGSCLIPEWEEWLTTLIIISARSGYPKGLAGGKGMYGSDDGVEGSTSQE